MSDIIYKPAHAQGGTLALCKFRNIYDEFSISAARARKAIEAILAIYKSAREQKPVKIS